MKSNETQNTKEKPKEEKKEYYSNELKNFKSLFERATQKEKKEQNKNTKKKGMKRNESVKLRSRNENELSINTKKQNKSLNNSRIINEDSSKDKILNDIPEEEIKGYLHKIKKNMNETKKMKELMEFSEIENIQYVNTNFIISNLKPKSIEIISKENYSKLCGNNYVVKSGVTKLEEKKKIDPKAIPKIKKKTYKSLCHMDRDDEIKKKEKLLAAEDKKRKAKRYVIPIDDSTYKKLLGEGKTELSDEEMKNLLKDKSKKEIKQIDDDTYQKLLGKFEIPEPIRKVNH